MPSSRTALAARLSGLLALTLAGAGCPDRTVVAPGDLRVATDVSYTAAGVVAGPVAIQSPIGLPEAPDPVEPGGARPTRVVLLTVDEGFAARLPSALLGTRFALNLAAPASAAPPPALFGARAAMLEDATIFLTGALKDGAFAVAEREARLFRGATLIVSAFRDRGEDGRLLPSRRSRDPAIGADEGGIERLSVLVDRRPVERVGEVLDVAIELTAPPGVEVARGAARGEGAPSTLGLGSAPAVPPPPRPTAPGELSRTEAAATRGEGGGVAARIGAPPPALGEGVGAARAPGLTLLVLEPVRLPATETVAIAIAVPLPFTSPAPARARGDDERLRTPRRLAVIVVEVRPRAGASDPVAEPLGIALALARGDLAREAAVARSLVTRRATPEPIGFFGGVPALRETLGKTGRPREALLAAGLATGARLATAGAAVLDDEAVAEAAGIVAAAVAAVPQDASSEAVGLAIERGLLDLYDRLIATDTPGMAAVRAALERRGGPALADSSAERHEAAEAASLDALGRLLIARDLELLDHAAASRRIAAAAWLRAGGIDLEGYDALAPLDDRLEAVRRLRGRMEATP